MRAIFIKQTLWVIYINKNITFIFKNLMSVPQHNISQEPKSHLLNAPTHVVYTSPKNLPLPNNPQPENKKQQPYIHQYEKVMYETKLLKVPKQKIFKRTPSQIYEINTKKNIQEYHGRQNTRQQEGKKQVKVVYKGDPVVETVAFKESKDFSKYDSSVLPPRTSEGQTKICCPLWVLILLGILALTGLITTIAIASNSGGHPASATKESVFPVQAGGKEQGEKPIIISPKIVQQNGENNEISKRGGENVERQPENYPETGYQFPPARQNHHLLLRSSKQK